MRTLADGIALTRFLRWLKHDAVREGATELSAAAKLEEYRRESADYLEPSFDPILAYGPHGAIVHYEATEETDVPLEAHGLLLADTGGHYRTGTTDVTRTVALGPVARGGEARLHARPARTPRPRRRALPRGRDGGEP